MCPDLFLVEAPCGLILVNDHLVFAFGVVTYGRFDCIHKKTTLQAEPPFILVRKGVSA